MATNKQIFDSIERKLQSNRTSSVPLLRYEDTIKPTPIKPVQYASPAQSTPTFLQDVGQWIEERPLAKNIIGGLNVLTGGSTLGNFFGNILDQKSVGGLSPESDVPFLADAGNIYRGAKQYFLENASEDPIKAAFLSLPVGIGTAGWNAKSGADVARGSFALGARLRGVDEETSKRLAKEAEKKYPKTAFASALAFDLAADPSNFVTFGSGSVAKAGARAANKAARGIAKDAGIKTSRKTAVQDVPELIYQKTLQKYQQNPKNLNVLAQQPQRAVASPDEIAKQVERITNQAIKRGVAPDKAAELARKAVKQGQQPAEIASRAEQLAQQARKAAQKKIEDAAKAARLKSSNALISLDIPFTNFTKTILSRRTPKAVPTVGEDGVRIVEQIFVRPTRPKDLTPEQSKKFDEKLEEFDAKVANFLSDTYGVTDPRKLTLEDVRDLQRRFEEAGGFATSKTFGLETRTGEKTAKDIRKVTAEEAFQLDEFLSKYSPEARQYATNMLRLGMTPEDIINELPNMLRNLAKTAGKKQVIPATTQPLPKGLADVVDELYYLDEISGKPTVPYDEMFNSILKMYNDPNIDKADLETAVRGMLDQRRQEFDQAEATRVATQKANADRIKADQLKAEADYKEAVKQYNEAVKQAKALAKTKAQKSRQRKFNALVKKWKAEVARIEKLQKDLAEESKLNTASTATARKQASDAERARKAAEAEKAKAEEIAKRKEKADAEAAKKEQQKKKPVQPAPAKPKPVEKTSYEEAKTRGVPEDAALLADEYAHFLRASGKSAGFVKNKVDEFINLVTRKLNKKESPEGVYRTKEREIEELKSALGGIGKPTGKKVSREIGGSQPFWKPYIIGGMSADIANKIHEIVLREIFLTVTKPSKLSDIRQAKSIKDSTGKNTLINTKRQNLAEEVMERLAKGESEADIYKDLKQRNDDLYDKQKANPNSALITELIRDEGKVAKVMDELEYTLPDNLKYKAPEGTATRKVYTRYAEPQAPKSVGQKIEEDLKPKPAPQPKAPEPVAQPKAPEPKPVKAEVPAKIEEDLKPKVKEKRPAAPQPKDMTLDQLNEASKKVVDDYVDQFLKRNGLKSTVDIPADKLEKFIQGMQKASDNKFNKEIASRGKPEPVPPVVARIAEDIDVPKKELEVSAEDIYANILKSLDEDLSPPPVKEVEAPPKSQPKISDEKFIDSKNTIMAAKGEVRYPAFLKESIAQHRKLFPNHVEKVITDANGKKVHVFTRSAEEAARVEKELAEKLKKDLKQKRRQKQLGKKISKVTPTGIVEIDGFKSLKPKFDGKSSVPSNWYDMVSFLYGKQDADPADIFDMLSRYGKMESLKNGSVVVFPDEKSAIRADVFSGNFDTDYYVYGQVGDKLYQLVRETPKQTFEEAFRKIIKKSKITERKFKIKPPEEDLTSSRKVHDSAPEKYKQSVERNFGKSAKIIYHDADTMLVEVASDIGTIMHVGMHPAKGGFTTTDILNYTGSLFTPDQLSRLKKAKEKWNESFKKANDSDLNTPFEKGKTFSASANVPKNIADITEQWKKMLGVSERLHLTTIEDAIASNYSGRFARVRIGAEGTQLGRLIPLDDGSFVIVYDPKRGVPEILETISHELGHAVMKSQYESASANVKKAIDDEYWAWRRSVLGKGKTAQQLVESLRPRKTAKTTKLTGMADDLRGYWKSKDEWFADQVSKWATTNEKPLSVVEKFFSRLAKVMKQFFQVNKQYLPSKTMEDWLNGLVKASENNVSTNISEMRTMKETTDLATKIAEDVIPKPAFKPESVDLAVSDARSSLKIGNVKIDLPKEPKLKDIPLIVKKLEDAIVKPKQPVKQAVPKAEPAKSRTLPKAKREELRKLRESLQPSGSPQVIAALDKRLVQELNKMAKKLEKQKPSTTRVVETVDLSMKYKGVKGVNKDAPLQRTKAIPFQKMRKEGAFQRDAGDTGTLRKMLRETKLLKMFSTKSLGTGNALVDSYGALIQQAGTRVSGESRYIRRDLREILKQAEGLTPEQMRAVQYVIENRFPAKMTDAEKQAILDNPQVQKVADLTRNLLGYLGKEELASGILKDLRNDYFPHLLKFNADKAEDFAKKYMNDPDLKGLAKGLSQKAGFSIERRGLPTLAEYDDLVQKLLDKKEKLTDSGAIERIDRKIEDLENIFNRDTVSVLNTRIYQSVRSRVMKDLYKQMTADGMITYSYKNPGRQFVKLSTDQARLLGIPSRTSKGNIYMHEDVLRGMEQVEEFFTDPKMNAVMEKWSDITRIWKLGTTVLIPRHYFNNLIGNLFNNGLAGVRTQNYADAMGFLWRMSKNKLSPEEQKMALNMYRDGVIGQGVNAEFRLPEDMTDRSALQRLADWAQNTWYARNLMHVGEAVDDWTRLALYMRGKEFGNSHQAGVEAVRKYLFNYHELTQADRFVRSTMVPFWMWMKNNIPLQIEQLIRQPRYYIAAEKIREATFEDDELQDQPEYIRDKGIEIFGNKYALSLPMYDLYMINGIQGTSSSVINSLNPMLTALAELAMNKDTFTGAPISKDLARQREEDYSGEDLVKYAARQFGGFIGSEALDLYRNVFEEERLTGGQQALRTGMGIFTPKPVIED